MSEQGAAALRTARVVAVVWAVVVYSGMILLGLSARALFGEVGGSHCRDAISFFRGN